MKRTRAERIYRNHIEPYRNCEIATVSIDRMLPRTDESWRMVWETIDKVPVNHLGENENGDHEYENSQTSWDNIKLLHNKSDIIRELEKDNPLYILPRYLQYGDYDNSCAVERSNYRLFMAQYGGEGFDDPYSGNEKGCFIFPGVHSLYGDYSNGVAILLDTWLRYEEIRETIGSLDDYPCIDDQDVSFLEMTLADEAWESWAEHDFRKELENKFGIIDWKDDTENNFRLFFENCRESVNEYWEVEGGGNSHVRIETIVEAIESLDWIPPESYSRDMPLCLSTFVESLELEETE